MSVVHMSDQTAFASRRDAMSVEKRYPINPIASRRDATFVAAERRKPSGVFVLAV